ncbi:MAG: hypothetical protein ACI4F3_13465 [Enterocloster sp.]
MKLVGDKVSYLRNPFAKNSFYSLGLAAAALVLAAVCMYMSVSRGGDGGLNTGAYGFSSLAASVMGIWYGILSFMEKERNYILARIGIGICTVLFIVWIVIIFTGLFR